MGPQVPFCDALHAEKYRGENESFREAMGRIASVLSDDRDHFLKLREILLRQAFLPGGRIQSAIGSTRNVTAYNCFVSGTIADSFVEGEGSIMDRAREAAATMRMGGGIGYDFSTLRPKGSLIRKLQSKSSGPIAFMQIFDAICRCVASSGHRRGAQMGVLRVDHPDIEEFVHAKQNRHNLTGFNTSVAVTDEFMRKLDEKDDSFDLRWGGEVYRTVSARALWEMIMRSTWDWAEPGVLFVDRINAMNNLAYCEWIAATNPCGEQPLPPFGACLLGSFNLTQYIRRNGECWEFDRAQFQADIPVVVRAMDNVVDRTHYPLPEQETEAKSKRRMGLGVTGAANAIEAMRCEYGGDQFCQVLDRILTDLATGAYEASIELAAEKGSFPLFKVDGFCYGGSEFVASLPLSGRHREMLAATGIRNSHLTSLAPTGTISMAADNVSSGIEPVFAYSAQRQYVGPDGMEEVLLEDYGFARLGVNGRRCSEVSPEEHLRVLATAQRWMDSAVSKTCNVPADTSWEDFKRIYTRAWELGCKGCTTFQVGGKRAGILESRDGSEEPQAGACRVDPETGKRECE